MGVFPTYQPSSNALQPVPDNEFARDVAEGMRSTQKVLPAKYLYDEIGSALFEAITLLPEYGLTRAEERLLHSCADEIAQSLTPLAAVTELGSGSGRKTERLLEAVTRYQRQVDYFAIDVSDAALQNCREHLWKNRDVRTHSLQLSYLDGLAKVREERPPSGRLLLLFLGSSIGNFSDMEVVRFLKGIRQHLSTGDAFLLGTDLVKSPKQLIDAYDDECGVTAAFNLNVLSRINKELDGDFQLRKFRHEARWRADKSRVEMHLVSLERQSVTIAAANCQVSFEPGESIWTESSQKFTAFALRKLALDTGFTPCGQWIDSDWPFAENLWVAS